ncbi:FIST N-terminal domain-containing protein [Acutalibacter caecimuris]|uniref:FIST N-terminal domain-containing protein n=1 Tax=Acutalibacter caecimuris TaxID=3093657 RepID=UPI0034605337
MKQFFGMSQSGNLDEALRGLHTPQFIMLLSTNEQFEKHVAELEKQFPGVPSIGCIGMGYHTTVVQRGVVVIAFYDGVCATANVLEEASTMPAKYIRRLEADIKTVQAAEENTVCIDFCSGNDACVLTTINTVLRRRNVCLMGGTGDQGRVSANGRVYQDAVAYGLVRNLGGPGQGI